MRGEPVLVVLGGPPGAGKTAISRRLSSELGLPRLSSDAIGRIIKGSAGIQGGPVNAYWIAYDVVFGLCEELLQSGVSTILDLNMGWEFQWQRLDALRSRHPATSYLTIILRCPRAECLRRIQERHDRDAAIYAPPEWFVTDKQSLQVWDFLDRLDRPDVTFLDAARPQDEVYSEIEHCLAMLPASARRRISRRR